MLALWSLFTAEGSRLLPHWDGNVVPATGTAFLKVHAASRNNQQSICWLYDFIWRLEEWCWTRTLFVKSVNLFWFAFDIWKHESQALLLDLGRVTTSITSCAIIVNVFRSQLWWNSNGLKPRPRSGCSSDEFETFPYVSNLSAMGHVLLGPKFRFGNVFGWGWWASFWRPFLLQWPWFSVWIPSPGMVGFWRTNELIIDLSKFPNVSK